MLPDAPSMLLFLTASVALLVTPGPAVFYILARSVDQGRLAGIVSTLGVAALIASSAVAFTVLKYVGAAYLVYLGVRRILSRQTGTGPTHAPPARLSRVFWQGVVVNILNPKTALFFLAFLPQFVQHDTGNLTVQVLVLGLLIPLTAVPADVLVACTGGTLAKRVARSARARSLLGGLGAALLVGLGLQICLL